MYAALCSSVPQAPPVGPEAIETISPEMLGFRASCSRVKASGEEGEGGFVRKEEHLLSTSSSLCVQ